MQFRPAPRNVASRLVITGVKREFYVEFSGRMIRCYGANATSDYNGSGIEIHTTHC